MIDGHNGNNGHNGNHSRDEAKCATDKGRPQRGLSAGRAKLSLEEELSASGRHAARGANGNKSELVDASVLDYLHQPEESNEHSAAWFHSLGGSTIEEPPGEELGPGLESRGVYKAKPPGPFGPTPGAAQDEPNPDYVKGAVHIQTWYGGPPWTKPIPLPTDWKSRKAAP